MNSMHKITRRQALAGMGASLGVGLASSPSLTAAQPGDKEFAEVDRRLRSAIDMRVFDGVGLLLCTADRTPYKRAFGKDTTETTHLLASATKLASTTAIMTLVDAKLLSLDDPIRRHLPKFGKVRGAITIRQLLAQTHGMPANHKAIPAPQRDNGMTLEECVNAIAKDDSVRYAAGSRHEYQPAISYQIAGRIAEVVTRQDWATLFQRRVAEPLEMKTFTYGRTKNPRIGGGASCALQDYGNLLQMHLAGGTFRKRRVLSEASVAEMQRDQLGKAPFTPSRVSGGRQYGYGLTWWIDLLNEKKEPVQFSCPGAWGAIPWLNRRARYAGFLLVERRLPEAWRLYSDLFPILNAMNL